jgi:hypothetical protein
MALIAQLAKPGSHCMTAEQFRRIALSLPEAEERAHMRHPDFRVGGKIFATLAYPNDDWGMIKLTPPLQKRFVAADPRGFSPVKGTWGERGCTSVCLKAARVAPVRAAMEAAWGNAQMSRRPRRADKAK